MTPLLITLALFAADPELGTVEGKVEFVYLRFFNETAVSRQRTHCHHKTKIIVYRGVRVSASYVIKWQRFKEHLDWFKIKEAKVNKGRYSLELPPGWYVIVAEHPNGKLIAVPFLPDFDERLKKYPNRVIPVVVRAGVKVSHDLMSVSLSTEE